MSTYRRIIERVFLDRYRPGDVEVDFLRDDLVDAAEALGLPVPKNLGDVLYTFRSRRAFPESVAEKATLASHFGRVPRRFQSSSKYQVEGW